MINANADTYMIFSDFATFTYEGLGYSVQKNHCNFVRIADCLRQGDYKGAYELFDLKGVIGKWSGGDIEMSDVGIRWRGNEIIFDFTDRLLRFIKDGHNIEPLGLVLGNLFQNVSHRSIDQFFNFISACRLPLTTDGHFLAYKRVRGDFKDCYTGKIDNSVGSRPKMDRLLISDDPNNACDKGLHVCSLTYLLESGYGVDDVVGHRLIICKVNPRDVVCVPYDYKNTKMRVCEYEVVAEFKGADPRSIFELDSVYSEFDLYGSSSSVSSNFDEEESSEDIFDDDFVDEEDGDEEFFDPSNNDDMDDLVWKYGAPEIEEESSEDLEESSEDLEEAVGLKKDTFVRVDGHIQDVVRQSNGRFAKKVV